MQSSVLSELTDSGSRIYEEQPLLEESFTIHLGAQHTPHSVAFFNSIALLYLFSINISTQSLIHFSLNQEHNLRRCTISGWSEQMYWTSANTGDMGAVERS